MPTLPKPPASPCARRLTFLSPRSISAATTPTCCAAPRSISASRSLLTATRASTPTPTEGLRPFYKKGAPNTSVLRAAGDPGFPLRVAGKVFNNRGERVPGARLDIWQADHQGHYDVQGYRYRTKLVVEPSAEY